MTFIVTALLIVLGLSVGIWCTSATYRIRVEEPKYRFLHLTRQLSNDCDAGGHPQPNPADDAAANEDRSLARSAP